MQNNNATLPGNLADDQLITVFESKLENMHEAEFGDFKRKVALYADRLFHSLSPSVQTKTLDHFEQLKNILVYSPNGDAVITRQQVLTVIENLRKEVNGRA